MSKHPVHHTHTDKPAEHKAPAPVTDPPGSLLSMLEGKSGPLHEIHLLLVAMLPHIDEAIAEAEGDVKYVLQALAGFLR
jgi:hypothetical protein